MKVYYRIYTVEPPKECSSRSEELDFKDYFGDALHTLRSLVARMKIESERLKTPVMGFVFVENMPAAMIRANGVIRILEKYSDIQDELLESIGHG
jgi:hypothetical protein